MEILIYGFFLLVGVVISYVGLKFTTVKALKSDLQNEISEKNSMKEELFQLRTINLQNEQNEKYLVERFKNIATEILEKNTADFSQTNQKELESMLKPFKENLSAFGEKMEHVKTQNTVLEHQIKTLEESSKDLSEQAQNLTKSLNGNAKIRGDWGEEMLKRILEASGLEKGVHYTLQDSFADEGRTDCIVRLAENKNIVVDSKVSLVPLQKYYKSQDVDSQKESLKELERSIRGHIDTLDKKAYQDIEEIGAPDYVLMFMPVENAFNLMVAEFDTLIDYAWKKRVLIVSPSTLMVALRTIALFWQQDKRNKNIDEIARLGAALYDKFVGIVEDLDDIAVGIKKTQDGYSNAMTKIKGRGGFASQTERLKVLGAKTPKQIPSELLEVE